MRRHLALPIAVALAAAALAAQQTPPPPATGYLLPPRTIVDILDAPPLPDIVVSPARDGVALVERSSMPTIAELAQPMLRLAGMRVNPRTNGPHRTPGYRAITLKRLADGSEIRVAPPANPNLGSISFSPDGARLAFTQTRDTGVELWIADVATGQAKPVTVAALNAAWGRPCEWLADSASLLCQFVASSRGPAPAPPAVPAGPNIQEHEGGKPAPIRTYQDLLTSAHDETLFEHYFTSQLAIVDAATGRRAPVGRPGLFEEATISPSSEYVLVARVKRPFSRLVPASDFPKDVEVWNRRGDLVKEIADLPLADTVPIDGVPTGPRSYRWHPAAPAVVAWVEALDEGNPKNKASYRDRLVTLAAPFAGSPAELIKTESRYEDVSWTDAGVALVTEYDRPTRRTRTWVLKAGADPRKLWDRSAEDSYANPGDPMFGPGSTRRTILQRGATIYVSGVGASPQGDRPFLDRLNLDTFATERIFRTDDRGYERVVALLDDEGRTALTRYETRADPPNFFVRELAAGNRRALTSYPDPQPQLRGVDKQLITYERKDGVKLSATLYLPPGYQKNARLPALLWAYPREFTDPSAASQVTGSANRFTTVSGPSHLLLLTQGYAILDNPAMPIVGPGETANDTYVEQLVASAQAAVDKVVEMGVADRDRLAIGGHSYGAFMTANLLAHSDIFRAGIARSGAYNRTLTPFGFQNEIRTFWEAPSVYARLSPFWYANTINEPILLTHGEADNNSGTFPIQTERFYMALKGHGATVRYVTLPNEAHGYAARESVLHTVAEMLNWCDKHVKHAKPRETTNSAAR